MILYHITKTKNIPSILEKGIIPNKRKGLSCNRAKWIFVFLTDDIKHIIQTQLGVGEYMKNYYSVLKIDCSGLQKLSEYNIFGDVVEHEFITPETIEPKNIIEVLDKNIYNQHTTLQLNIE